MSTLPGNNQTTNALLLEQPQGSVTPAEALSSRPDALDRRETDNPQKLIPGAFPETNLSTSVDHTTKAQESVRGKGEPETIFSATQRAIARDPSFIPHIGLEDAPSPTQSSASRPEGVALVSDSTALPPQDSNPEETAESLPGDTIFSATQRREGHVIPFDTANEEGGQGLPSDTIFSATQRDMARDTSPSPHLGSFAKQETHEDGEVTPYDRGNAICGEQKTTERVGRVVNYVEGFGSEMYNGVRKLLHVASDAINAHAPSIGASKDMDAETKSTSLDRTSSMTTFADYPAPSTKDQPENYDALSKMKSSELNLNRDVQTSATTTRTLEEVNQVPVFTDGGSVAASKYEAVFEPVSEHFQSGKQSRDRNQQSDLTKRVIKERKALN